MADSYATRVYDATVQRAVRTERFKAGFIRQLIALLDDSTADIVERLIRTGEGTVSRSRLETMLRELRKLNADLKGVLEERLVDELEAFAADEAERVAAQFNRALPPSMQAAIQFIVPSEAVLFTAAEGELKNTLVRGRSIQNWVDDLVKGDADRVAQAVRLGFVEGEGMDRIARRISGTAALRFRDGERGLTKRQLDALVRTSVQSAATEARSRVYSENEPLLKGVRWVSTLDGRTSSVCRSLDQKTFPVDSGPRPPAHFNCRSTTIPVIKTWEELGFDGAGPPPVMRPYVRSTKRLRDIPKADRHLLRGKAPGDEPYSEWLRKQPQTFVEEVLGPMRARLFLDGGLSIERFRDVKMPSDWTLDDLRRREPEAWREAFGGGDPL